MPTLNQLLGRPARGLLNRSTQFIQQPSMAWYAIRRHAMRLMPRPAVFHITHYKAGSQWIHRILNALAPDRVVAPEVACPQFLDRKVLPGKVYPTLYVTREQFDAVPLPNQWRRFIVIRDLRDTLISAYFSLKHSHKEIAPQITTMRGRLNDMTLEQGLLRMTAEWLPPVAAMQRSWAATGEPLIRYADLLTDDVAILERVLIDHCKMLVTRAELKKVVLANRFEVRTKGRVRGKEDINSHERMGVSGEWRKYFTDAIAKSFKKLHGDILISTGYERDNNW